VAHQPPEHVPARRRTSLRILAVAVATAVFTALLAVVGADNASAGPTVARPHVAVH
jgi:hypothetical protein